ncbi:MAG: hypothetical protein V1934_06490 [Methanobacteriota archaeon]
MAGLEEGAWARPTAVSILVAAMLFTALAGFGPAKSTLASADPIMPFAAGSYVPGTDWVKYGVVLDIGAPGQESHVLTPTVIKLTDGSYAMWYEGRGLDGHQRIYKATSNDGLSWTLHGVAIDYGEPYAEFGVMFPFVMVDDSGLYHMWYAGYNGYKHTRILQATSVDGWNWTKLGPELSSGSVYDPDGVSNPRLHFDGTQWHMWYSGSQWNPLRIWVCHAHKAALADPWIKDGIVLYNDADYDNNVAWAQYIVPNDNGYDMFYGGRSPDQYPGRICHASSADGLNWTKTGIALDRTLPGESVMCDFPSVLVDDGVYKMWYTGYDGVHDRTFYAESAAPVPVETVDLSISSSDVATSNAAPVEGDSVNITATVHGDASTASGWEKRGVVMDVGGAYQNLHVDVPSVLRLPNGTYAMYYVGEDTHPNWRIFRAFSYDGINWTKQGVVLNYGGAYAGVGVCDPYVVLDASGKYHMWYTGYNAEAGGNRMRILYATSTTGFNFQYQRMEVNYGGTDGPDSVRFPYVVQDDSGQTLFYDGASWYTNPRSWVNHAHCATGAASWTKDGKVITSSAPFGDNQGRAWVLGTEAGYEAFYTCYDASGISRILRSTSPDGYAWTLDGVALEPTIPEEGTNVRWCSVIAEGDVYKMWYSVPGVHGRIFYAEKAPGHVAQDATCDVSFYMDTVDPMNLIGSVEDVFVPANGQAQASLDWSAVAGDHDIIVEVGSVVPADSDLSNNVAVASITVSDPPNPATVDLAVFDNEISLPEEAETGEVVTVAATIHNPLSLGAEWVKKGVVLNPDISAQYPCVIKDGAVYKMWYAGFGAPDIYYATSTDRVNWTNYGRVLIHPSGTTYAAAPSVMRDSDGTYKMWYSCQNYNWNSEIYYATSPDGITWTKAGKVLSIGSVGSFDSVYACQGYVFKESGLYKMYYKAYDAGLVSRMGYATSADGVAWVKQGCVMELPAGYTGMECPMVLPDGAGSYDMWFNAGSSGTCRILSAHSTDGITWSQGVVELEGTPGDADSAMVYTPFVMPDGGDLCLYYSGNAAGSASYIFLAEKIASGSDATCTVSFYLDCVDEANLICRETEVFVPMGGQTTVEAEWSANPAGEHEVIVAVSDVSPTDSDLTNNVASETITVAEPASPAELEISKVMLSGITEGYTFTHYEWELLITVSNVGGSDAEDIVVRDVLPAELELLEMLPSDGTACYLNEGDAILQLRLPPIIILPVVRATHITWTIAEMAPGAEETLCLKICTRVNPGGNQEFTFPGNYTLNDGAWLSATDTLTGDEISAGPTPPITVEISGFIPQCLEPRIDLGIRYIARDEYLARPNPSPARPISRIV